MTRLSGGIWVWFATGDALGDTAASVWNLGALLGLWTQRCGFRSWVADSRWRSRVCRFRGLFALARCGSLAIFKRGLICLAAKFEHSWKRSRNRPSSQNSSSRPLFQPSHSARTSWTLAASAWAVFATWAYTYPPNPQCMHKEPAHSSHPSTAATTSQTPRVSPHTANTASTRPG